MDEAFCHPIDETMFLSREEPRSLLSLASGTEKSWPCEMSEIVDTLATHTTVQHATGLGEDSLRKRLENAWSPDIALRECE